MQQTLFKTEEKIKFASTYTKEYCIDLISRKELWLWDMRCWDKPKYQYTLPEIVERIKMALNDEAEGNMTMNCGHCLFCVRLLLDNKWATMEEIARLAMMNNNIQYPNNIGEWNKSYETDISSHNQGGETIL
jgi:hypothetical protein